MSVLDQSLRSRALALIVGAGCASSPGTRPHDMSAAEHRAAAAREAGEAREHVEEESLAQSEESSYDGQGEHAGQAELHSQTAADHGAAAEALQAAEEAACSGVSAFDRDTSLFIPRSRILSVTRVQKLVRSKDGVFAETLGAAITLRSEPSMTEEKLHHWVRCHTARAATLGHEMPGMSDCPLVLAGVRASVSSTDAGLTVRITSTDSRTAREVLRRAEALAGRHPPAEPIPSW